jgi:hypothetical protein
MWAACGRMIVNDESGVWEEMVMTYFKVLSLHGGTKEKP